MHRDQVILDPSHQVIFKSSSYKLMENVGRQQLVDICSWEILREGLRQERYIWLACKYGPIKRVYKQSTYHYITNETVFIP
jgi:hypothetical protein